MKNISCSVIEDILPLYIDEICNYDTKKLVEEHLKNCDKCQEKYRQMTGTIVTESEIPTPEEKKIKKSIRKMKLFKYALILIVALCFLTVFAVIPVVNSVTGSGITYNNFKDVYAVNSFFNALEKQKYEKAFSYLDTAELSQDDDVTYRKFKSGMEQLCEGEKGFKNHRQISVTLISGKEYQVEVRCTTEDDSYIIITLHVTDGKISPYMEWMAGDDKIERLWDEISKFVYTDEELGLY